MGSLYHLTPVKAALVCGAALALSLAAGCSKSGQETPQAQRATIEQLAQKTGCTLIGKRDSKELKQGQCKTSAGRYVLVSFTDDKGRDAWLTEAKPWGGTYLVGPGWVAVATPQILETLRKDLGGSIVHGDQHGVGDKNGGHGPGHSGG
ncbi:hypothetical protein Acsp03_11390 [Actinomadura sp. NBRC 104412]|uniref:hypothetical protein n=1 Tax=Actinomadura sp. NBRC 104412 TaxID=3032203 RepID=UPI0024A547CB|nr:hypothetical protein [Actinomadura sp. NBRC 104412]GLZ03672.1 hypothetical protein Acsp03_11390 [Actinomadura sp. NBRC 104412]